MTRPKPIPKERRAQLEARVRIKLNRCKALAEDYLGTNIPPIDVSFPLRGKVSGQYRYSKERGPIGLRFHWRFLDAYEADYLATTVPHEFCHYLVHLWQGFQKGHGHTPEWYELMKVVGSDGGRYHDYDLRVIGYKRMHCACRTYTLSPSRAKAGARCRNCDTVLVADDDDSWLA